MRAGLFESLSRLTTWQILHLVDLMQKRANFQEARAAGEQAQEAATQTKHSLLLTKRSAAQGQMLMVFTLLTAVYVCDSEAHSRGRSLG